MNETHVTYFAAKFFPHLLLPHAKAVVREILVLRGLMAPQPSSFNLQPL